MSTLVAQIRANSPSVVFSLPIVAFTFLSLLFFEKNFTVCSSKGSQISINLNVGTVHYGIRTKTPRHKPPLPKPPEQKPPEKTYEHKIYFT